MTKNILKILGLAIAGSVFSSICASAAILSEMDSTNFQPAALDPTAFSGPSILGPSPSNTYSDMDAILGFRVLAGTGAGSEGMIDLGSVTQFTSTSTFTLSLGAIGTFMTTNFGSDWFTRSTSGQVGKTDIQWGVVATDNNTNFTSDLWASRSPAVRGTPWNSAANQDIGSNSVNNVGLYFNTGGVLASGGVSAKRLSSSNPSSWTSNNPGTTSFQNFNPDIEGNTSAVLSFDYVPAGSTNAGTTLGTFTWLSSGDVVWTGTAVPEPETYRLMALGAVGLVGLMILRRRRTVRA